MPCAGRHFPKIPGANSHLAHFGSAHLFGLTNAMKYVGGEDKWVAQMRYQTSGKKKIWCASMKQIMEAFSKADPDAAQSIQSAASAFGRLDVKMAERCKDHGLTLQVAVAEEGDVVYIPSGMLLAEETLNSQTILGIKVAALQGGKSLDALATVRAMQAKEDPNGPSVGYMDAYVKLAETCDSEQEAAAAKHEKDRVATERQDKAAKEKLERAAKDSQKKQDDQKEKISGAKPKAKA